MRQSKRIKENAACDDSLHRTLPPPSATSFDHSASVATNFMKLVSTFFDMASCCNRARDRLRRKKLNVGGGVGHLSKRQKCVTSEVPPFTPFVLDVVLQGNRRKRWFRTTLASRSEGQSKKRRAPRRKP